jgi:hypothetical protein
LVRLQHGKSGVSDIEKAGFLDPPSLAGQRLSVVAAKETRPLMLKKPGF